MMIDGAQFDSLLESNRLVLTMLGMSNVGKSFWSRRLARAGFERIGMDDIIAQALYDSGELSQKSDAALAQWLGMPYEHTFPLQQKKLLAYEAALTKKIADKLSHGVLKNTVIDPGGSIIYTPAHLQTSIKENSLVVYIEATAQMKDDMLKKFLQHPKALIWAKSYDPLPGEAREQTLARCYPILLASRNELYRRLADITLPFTELPHRITGDELLGRIRAHL